MINQYFALSWVQRILWSVPWGLEIFLKSRQAVAWAQEINFLLLYELYTRGFIKQNMWLYLKYCFRDLG